jgi:hypothetical protein
MDKKKIYIIVIVLCLVVTAGVLYYGFFSQPSVDPVIVDPTQVTLPGTNTPSGGSAASSTEIPTPNGGVAYPAPSVFPQNSKIDESVFSSAKFRSLQDYVPLTVSPEEMGRDNPFAPYAGN